MDPFEKFVLEHAREASVPLVPEVKLLLASEVTPLWHATERWLKARGVPPPFWAFAWAGGIALARFVLDHPEIVAGQRVLDFASGSGLVAIAAGLSGAADVRAVDIDPFALAAVRTNARRNGVAVTESAANVVGQAVGEDVLLAGDVFYERSLAEPVAAWFREVAGKAKPSSSAIPGELIFGPTTASAWRVTTSLRLASSKAKR